MLTYIAYTKTNADTNTNVKQHKKIALQESH